MLPRDHYLKQAFQDLIHFPNGFEKGGLSDIQARLVRKYGTLISALCIEEVSDATPDDLHILKVIANQSAPKNPVEQAWIKYLSILKSMDGNLSSKNKGTKAKTPKPANEKIEPEIKDEVTAKSSKPAKATKADTPAPTQVKASKTKPQAKGEAPAAKKTTKA